MTSLLLLPLPAAPSTRPPSEAEMFQARAAHFERLLRRRRWLRLRATVFGRAKLAARQRPGTLTLRPAVG